MAGTQIASLYAKISADISEFQRGMGQAKSEMSAFSKTHDAIGGALKLAAGVGVGAIAGLGKGIYDATQQAADMEQQVANIAAVMGQSRDEIEPLNDLIMELGLNPQLQVSAVEAAQAIEMLAKNGLTLPEIMDGAAEATVRLANSTGADFATAADIATDAMSMFGIDAGNMMKAVDGITGVTVSSKFSIDDYRLALAQAGGVASSVGVDFDDFNAVIADISPSFASGSDAGTSFKTFLQRLVPQSEAAETAMHELGLEFFNADGSMKSMSEIAQELSDGFAGLSEEQKINAASTIFGTDAMRAAFELAKGGAGDIDALRAAMADTSAIESSRTRMDTFRGAMEILSGVMETLTIRIGQAFLPAFRDIVEGITGFLESNGATIVDWFDSLAVNIAAAPDKIATLVAKISEWWGTVQPIIQPFVDFIGEWVNWGDVITALGILIGTFVATTLAGFITAVAPVVAVIGGLVIAVAAVRTAWENDWGGIQTKTLAAKDYLVNRFGELGGAIQKFGGDALHEIGLWINGQETDFAAAKEIWGAAKNSFGMVAAEVKGILEQWAVQLGEWASAAWQAFAEKFPNAAATLQGAWDRTKETVQRFWDTVKPLLDKAIEWIQKTANEWRTGSENMSGVMEKAKIAIDGILSIIVKAVETFINNAIDTLTLLIQFFSGDFEGAWETAQGMIKRTLDAWKGIAETALDTFLGVFGLRLDDLKRMVQRTTEYGRDLINNLWSGMKGIWDQVYKWLGRMFDKLPEPVKEQIRAAASWGRDLIQGFWDGIQERWNSFWGWIQNKWTELSNGFKRFFGIRSPSKMFEGYGRDLMQGLVVGIDKTMPAVDAAIGDVQSSVTVAGEASMPMTDTRGDDDLAAAIRALVATLQARGGNQINVTMPQATGNTRSDLAATVQYLQALYA